MSIIKMTNPKLDRNAPCWCGSGRKYKQCHAAFDDKIRRAELTGHEVPPHSILKTKEQIEGIKASAAVNMAALDAVAEVIHAGMSTGEIDRIVHELTIKAGAIPAPLGYQGFPKSCCTSINREVCHGIPSDEIILKEGDIVNVDCSTILKGYFSDSSRMFMIGEVSPEYEKIVRVAKECMDIGISMVKPWTYLGDMGHAVHEHALANGCSVVRQIGGHGCGLEFHEDPWVSYVSKPGQEMLMVPGMVFTIEPMVNLGTDEIYEDADNGWTIYTEDGMPSAQWESQVLVTEDGCEILAH